MLLLLEYKTLNDPNIKPIAPIEVWTEGLIEETILSWTWYEGNDGIFKRGWFGLRKLNFDHPHMIAFIEKLHQDQKECLRNKSIRYPFWG